MSARFKVCRGACGEEWPIECFTRDRHNPDGRRNECTACRQDRRRELERTKAVRKKPWQLKLERGYMRKYAINPRRYARPARNERGTSI